MRILHTKGKMGRWFEFTLFLSGRTVTIKEPTIKAVMPGNQGGSLICYDGASGYFHVVEPYEEVLKVLTLEERD